MKSLVYCGVRDVRVEEVADPVLTTPDAALVRIKACSICGSDLHPYRVDQGRAGHCMGHEAIGEIVETGRNVSRFRIGDRVLLPASLSCGRCPTCLAGEAVSCEIMSPRVFGQGIPGIGGCQAEAVEVPMADSNMFILPAGMTDEIGLALTDAMPTGWLAAAKARIRSGDTIAVIGLGSVGLAAILAAFAQGAERIFAMDLVPARRAAAAALGATPFEGKDADDAIKTATRGLGADVVIDAHGSEQTLLLAMNLVRKGGTISIVGVPDAMTATFPVTLALVKSISILYAICSIHAQLPSIFEALEHGRLREPDIQSFFTHSMDLTQGPEAYRLFDSRAEGVNKIVLRC